MARYSTKTAWHIFIIESTRKCRLRNKHRIFDETMALNHFKSRIFNIDYFIILCDLTMSKKLICAPNVLLHSPKSRFGVKMIFFIYSEKLLFCAIFRNYDESIVVPNSRFLMVDRFHY